jgi:hypothetical protein
MASVEAEQAAEDEGAGHDVRQQRQQDLRLEQLLQDGQAIGGDPVHLHTEVFFIRFISEFFNIQEIQEGFHSSEHRLPSRGRFLIDIKIVTRITR